MHPVPGEGCTACTHTLWAPYPPIPYPKPWAVKSLCDVSRAAMPLLHVSVTPAQPGHRHFIFISALGRCPRSQCPCLGALGPAKSMGHSCGSAGTDSFRPGHGPESQSWPLPGPGTQGTKGQRCGGHTISLGCRLVLLQARSPSSCPVTLRGLWCFLECTLVRRLSLLQVRVPCPR